MGIEETTKELFIHFQKFIGRTQLRGIFGFRKANLIELEALSKIHRTYYPTLWEEAGRGFGKKKEIKDIRVQLLEVENKKPKASQELIFSCFKFEDIGSRGDLSLDCESFFSSIQASLRKRLESNSGKAYEQFNSAIVLFCAELMVWLKRLAQCSCDQDTLNEVLKRIDYLYAVEERPVFEDESPSDYQIQTLIFEIREALEQKIVMRIKWETENESVREHFKRVKLFSEAFVRYSVNALFCLFSNLNPQDAKEFQIEKFKEENKKTKSPLFNFQNTRLGGLLPLLPGIEDSFSSSALIALSDVENFFLLENGRPKKELINNLLRPDEERLAIRNTGLHPVIEKHPDLGLQLITVLGYLSDFRLFFAAFEQAYKLAGEGGNIFLCHFLEHDSQNLLAAFLQRISETKDSLMQIDTEAHKLYSQYAMQCKEKEWRQKYATFKLAIRKIMEELKNVQKYTIKILKCMEKVNTREYKEKIAGEIKTFQKIVSTLSKRVFHQELSLEQAQMHSLESSGTAESHLLPGVEKRETAITAASSQLFFSPEGGVSERTRELLARAEKFDI